MILAIETSCDDSAVALLDTQGKLIYNQISSQVQFHERFGGIVPEIASRQHLSSLPLLLRHLFEETGITQSQLTAVAVTYAPGLIGSVLVGVSYAKAIAWANQIPLIPVDHLEGHLLAPMLDHPELQFPFLALIISGGHTHLLEARGFQDYHLLGKTMDDAAGEAYDKVAKLLGFTYPGGPIIDRLAKDYPHATLSFPIPLKGKKTFNFSFSGIKTAVKNEAIAQNLYVEKKELLTYQQFQASVPEEKKLRIGNIAASFQKTMIQILSERIWEAIKATGLTQVVLTGGVAANQGLNQTLTELAQRRKFQVFAPKPIHCTDNAAMIGLVALKELQESKKDYTNYLALNASSKSPLGLLQAMDDPR